MQQKKWYLCNQLNKCTPVNLTCKLSIILISNTTQMHNSCVYDLMSLFPTFVTQLPDLAL